MLRKTRFSPLREITLAYLGIFALVFSNVQGLPESNSALTAKDYENGQKLELDNVNIGNYEQLLVKESGMESGKAHRVVKWPNATLPYTVSPDFTDTERAHLARGICEIETKSCVRFVPDSETGLTQNVVNIVRPDEYENPSCSSYIGMQVREQPLVLHSACFQYAGVVVHEFMHALGFIHEHSRADRDEYLDLHLENLSDNSKLAQFSIWNPPAANYEGTYDYGSIMHYSPHDIAKPGTTVFTPLKPVPSSVKIGRAREMSEDDKVKLNRWYACDTVKVPPPNKGCKKTRITA